MRQLLIVTTTALGVMIPVTSFANEQPCSDRNQVIAFLRHTHGEYLVGRGLSFGGRAVEIYASDAGSWSVIWTSPEGKSCLVASGEGWEQANKAVASNKVLPPTER